MEARLVEVSDLYLLGAVLLHAPDVAVSDEGFLLAIGREYGAQLF
jgi:hypothetical protein